MSEVMLLDAVEGLIVHIRELFAQPHPHHLREGRPARANAYPDEALPETVFSGYIAGRRQPALYHDRLKRPRLVRRVDAGLAVGIGPEVLLLVAVLIVRHKKILLAVARRACSTT